VERKQKPAFWKSHIEESGRRSSRRDRRKFYNPWRTSVRLKHKKPAEGKERERDREREKERERWHELPATED
jgi:hypothetical protein